MGAFTEFVIPENFKISNAPDYVFLCGGPLDDSTHSLRAHFYESVAKPNPALLQKVLLAEEADKWYRSQVEFRDLLELEEYIAGLAGCVFLFVESPGAIAEFGAFSQMRLLQEKLLVVVEDSHYSRQSFIRNGLIERTMRERPTSLLTYAWLSGPDPSGMRVIDTAFINDTLSEIERALNGFLAAKPKTTRFAHEDHGHRMLLITDLIKLGVILQQSEIQELLSRLAVSVTSHELRRYLYLLERLDLVSKRRHGSLDYFLATDKSGDYVHYASKKPADRARLRVLLRDEFPMKDEKRRALDSFQRRSTVVTP